MNDKNLAPLGAESKACAPVGVEVGVLRVQEADCVPHVHPEYGSGIFFTEDCILTSPAPSVGEPDTTMWAVQITGPDCLYAAPDRQVADAVALVLNRQFARHPFPSEVRVTAEVVAWPHGYESWSAQKDLLQLEVKGMES